MVVWVQSDDLTAAGNLWMAPGRIGQALPSRPRTSFSPQLVHQHPTCNPLLYNNRHTFGVASTSLARQPAAVLGLRHFTNHKPRQILISALASFTLRTKAGSQYYIVFIPLRSIRPSGIVARALWPVSSAARVVASVPLYAPPALCAPSHHQPSYDMPYSSHMLRTRQWPGVLTLRWLGWSGHGRRRLVVPLRTSL